MSDVGIFTAQNIFINFRMAGLGDRIAAFVIDGLVMLSYILLASFISGLLPDSFTSSWMMVLLYLPVFFYHLIFEYIMNGQTPGKKQMKIRVLQQEGSPATLGSYLLRWMLSPVDFMMSGGIAMISIIMTQKGQRIGDLAAGTIVVKEKELADYNKKFFHYEAPENHEVNFPTVKHRIEQKDIDVIREALRVRVDNQVAAPAEQIRTVIEKKLEVKTELSTVDFLHKVIKDFNFFHGEGEAV